jgi:short-subunit dehydrogenase
MSRRSFDDAVVIVTGAASGLGRALAFAFAAAGARLALLDRDAAGLRGVAGELGATGAVCEAIECDVTDAAACAAAVAATVSRFGRVDALVNNAGISHRSGFAATRLEVIRRVVEVNLMGAIHMTHAALPGLIAHRGLVIAISSVAGFSPLVARTGYAASKHGLHGFFDSLRTEVQPDGVDVLVVCPSFIATAIDRNALGADGQPVRHGQVAAGGRASADIVAQSILRAAERRRKLLLVGTTARAAWWLNRLAPALYARIMVARLRAELAASRRVT